MQLALYDALSCSSLFHSPELLVCLGSLECNHNKIWGRFVQFTTVPRGRPDLFKGQGNKRTFFRGLKDLYLDAFV
jgi:hypothetical protein